MQRIEIELAQVRHHRKHGGGGDEHRVSVRRRARHHGAGDRAGRAALVLDHDRHAEPAAEPFGQDARDAVAGAAGWKRDDEADRPVRKGRARAAGDDGDGAEHGDEQRPHGQTAGTRHCRISEDELVWSAIACDAQLFSNSRHFAISILTRNGDHRTASGRRSCRMRVPRFAAHVVAIARYRRPRHAGARAGMAVGHGARGRALRRRRAGGRPRAAPDRAAGGADQGRVHPGEPARRRRLDRPAGRRAGGARRRHACC